jgi:hypothetical protein
MRTLSQESRGTDRQADKQWTIGQTDRDRRTDGRMDGAVDDWSGAGRANEQKDCWLARALHLGHELDQLAQQTQARFALVAGVDAVAVAEDRDAAGAEARQARNRVNVLLPPRQQAARTADAYKSPKRAALLAMMDRSARSRRCMDARMGARVKGQTRHQFLKPVRSHILVGASRIPKGRSSVAPSCSSKTRRTSAMWKRPPRFRTLCA